MIDSGAALAPCAVMAASSPMPARPGAVTASSNAPVAAPSFPTKLVSFGISEDCWRWRSVALANWQRAKAKRGDDDDPVEMSFRFGARLWDRAEALQRRGRA
jgi:hypothetical protein